MNKEFQRHVQVTVQGTNAAGKSTVAHLIEKMLTDKGFNPTLIQTSPFPELYDEGNTDLALQSMLDKERPVEVVIVDHCAGGSQITSFKQVLCVMDATLCVKHGDEFNSFDEKKKTELRREYLRDACRRRGIPFSLAALIAPRLCGKRGLWDVVE